MSRNDDEMCTFSRNFEGTAQHRRSAGRQAANDRNALCIANGARCVQPKCNCNCHGNCYGNSICVLVLVGVGVVASLVWRPSTRLCARIDYAAHSVCPSWSSSSAGHNEWSRRQCVATRQRSNAALSPVSC